jgi:hypothetical protein
VVAFTKTIEPNTSASADVRDGRGTGHREIDIRDMREYRDPG